MQRIQIATLLLSGLAVLPCQVLPAQEVRRLPLLEESTVRIEGTSNKSDWTVDVTEMEGMLWISNSDDGFEPDSVWFRARTEDLKSGRSSIMDRLMYRALKSDEHPDIVFTLGSSDIESLAGSDTTRWSTTGMLELAGVGDTLAATVAGYKDSNGRLVFAGSHSMSMREHDITPPTAMFGALRTREKITIQFTLVFGKADL